MNVCIRVQRSGLFSLTLMGTIGGATSAGLQSVTSEETVRSHRMGTDQEDTGMTLTDIAASLTAERLLAKCTGGRERPSRDEIARLAYHFYETRGRQHGHDIDDWLSAEQELTPHYQ